MPHSTEPQGTGPAWTSLRGLLDLLDRGAPAEDIRALAAGARAANLPAGEHAAIEDAVNVALRVRRTLGQHRRREAELAALFDTAGDLAALRDLDAVLRAIVHRAKLLLGTDVTYLSLNDEQAGDTYIRVTDGSVSAAFQRVRLGLGEGLGGLVAECARPYTTNDYQDDQQFVHTTAIDSAVLDEGLRAILGVPLRLGAEVIGVLYAADRTPRTFTPDEVALLSSLADHAAIAIDSARMLEETRNALDELNTASRTIEAHHQAMRRAEEAHDRLTDLVLRGGDLAEVAAAIGTVLRGGTVIHDAEGSELARAGADPQHTDTDAVVASRADGRAVPHDGVWVCAVLAGPELLGSISLTGRADLEEADRRLFERAAVVTALLLMLRRSVAETEDRVRGELLGDLLTPGVSGPTLTARARRLGVDLGRPHSVLVLQGDQASRQQLLAATARTAAAHSGLAGLHQDHVVLMCPGDGPSTFAKSLAQQLSQSLATPITVGAAGPAAGPQELSAAHDEAARCLVALRALGHQGQGAALTDLGFVGVLLGDRTDLTGYVDHILGPVLAYDARRGTELLHTLRVYFAAGMSQARASEALHLHVNTVVQRLDRIGRLLGRDWQDPARSLEIQLALRVHEVSPAGEG
ncbi:helix-turn-helix domain-containing protein [Streptomyces sp. NBC_01439]|uniref:helix-turn-helix domain-containing protein n=1 Tax=Streptomyces sp. NBC_01439 TaxID=2903867 RepID=UPI002E292CFA|nr:helix-turn-helix domain-containing protein [Streptomyces sp. NBC_01439]